MKTPEQLKGAIRNIAKEKEKQLSAKASEIPDQGTSMICMFSSIFTGIPSIRHILN